MSEEIGESEMEELVRIRLTKRLKEIKGVDSRYTVKHTERSDK